MFCPNCKSEYRAGFTQCSDCGAALVEDSDAEVRRFNNSASDLTSDTTPDMPMRLWAGSDARIWREFRASLEAAGIAFVDEPSPRFIYSSIRPPMEIWISRSDKDAAMKVRRSIMGVDEESPDGISPVATGDESRVSSSLWGYSQPSPLDAWTGRSPGSQSAPDRIARDLNDYEGDSEASFDYFSSAAPDNVFTGEFFPEDATAEVYSGDPDMAQNLKVCIRENGIPSVIERPESGANAAKLRVLPEHEARAKSFGKWSTPRRQDSRSGFVESRATSMHLSL
jgi:hypothetical protein